MEPDLLAVHVHHFFTHIRSLSNLITNMQDSELATAMYDKYDKHLHGSKDAASKTYSQVGIILE